MTTTINDMNDLARILREQPEWVDILRSLLLSKEVLGLPALVAELVAAVSVINRRLDRLEGRFSNMEGNDYERRMRYRVLTRATTILGLEEPYLALTQNDPESPQLSAAVSRALQGGTATHDEVDDLHNTDIIISALGNRHLAVEVSLHSNREDFIRAVRRAGVLARVTGGEAIPVVVVPEQPTEGDGDLPDGVSILIIPPQ